MSADKTKAGTVLLDSQTNSDEPIPHSATFDKKQLDSLTEWASSLFDWEHQSDVWSVKTGVIPDCEFLDDLGHVWHCPESDWEHTSTDISNRSVTVIWTNKNGHELFFQYHKED